MTCPDCERNKYRAALWRAEAYRQAGHGVIERKWVGLTDEEIDHAAEQSDNYSSFIAGALFAQDKLEEKNEVPGMQRSDED
jgi:hypothetical protein